MQFLIYIIFKCNYKLSTVLKYYQSWIITKSQFCKLFCHNRKISRCLMYITYQCHRQINEFGLVFVPGMYGLFLTNLTYFGYFYMSFLIFLPIIYIWWKITLLPSEKLTSKQSQTHFYKQNGPKTPSCENHL